MSKLKHLDDEGMRALLDSRLDIADEAAATQHIADCETCRDKLTSIVDEPDLLDQLARFKSAADSVDLASLDEPLFPMIEKLKRNAIPDGDMSDLQTWVRGDTSAWTPPPPGDSSDVEEFALPEQLGRYKILEKLGRGGQAAVYRAYDTSMDRFVALKVPRSTCFHEGKQRFYQEVRAASHLDHPTICRNLDAGEIDGIPYLTMSFIEGRTLSHWRRQEPAPSLDRVVAVVRKLALGLDAAHREGVTHRDLKPANIMIKPNDEPVIMDFGLARRESGADLRLTVPGLVLGTPGYMSPEQASGNLDKLGPASDIYSLGVILFELLTGGLPYQGRIDEVLKKIVTGSPPSARSIRPEIPRELNAICEKAIAKEPEDRYATAGAMAEALALIPRPSNRAAANKRRLLPWMVAAALTLCVLGALGGFLLDRPGYLDPGKEIGLSGRGSGEIEAEKAIEVNEPKRNETASNEPDESSQATGEPAVPAGLADLEAAAASAAPVSLGTPVVTKMSVDVQRHDWKTNFKDLHDVTLPLNDNDRLQVHVQVSSPAYVYIWWYDAKGVAARLYPLDLTDQEQQVEVWDPPLAQPDEAQKWHVLGGDFGHELILAAVSPHPLSASELASFRQIRIHVRQRDSTGDLVALTRAPVGKVESPKGRRRRPADEENLALLVLPAGSERRVSAITAELFGGGSLAETNQLEQASSTESIYLDLGKLLSERFTSYHGLVFPHLEE